MSTLMSAASKIWRRSHSKNRAVRIASRSIRSTRDISNTSPLKNDHFFYVFLFFLMIAINIQINTKINKTYYLDNKNISVLASHLVTEVVQWITGYNDNLTCIFKIIKNKGLLFQRMKGNHQNFADVSSQEEENQSNVYQIESINEDDKYMKSFDGQHLNYFLSLRKKPDSRVGTEEELHQLEPIALNKMHSASEQLEKQREFNEQKDNSLIFRPKNKRKIHQNAVRYEQNSNKISENALFCNPQKGKKQGKLQTRRSQEYQPQFHWFQSQNPANQTLPN